jgi:MFS family permease
LIGGERLGPLAERDFRLLFLGRTVSIFGSAMAPIALAFAVLDLTGSATDLGVVLAASTISQIVFLLVGGVWADRLPRHHVMVASDLAAGALQALTAALLLTGAAEIWHLVAIQALRGMATAFFFPASTGLVPQLVGERHLQQANALLRLSLNGSNIGGAALGGIVVAAFGPGSAMAVDSATYLAGTAFLLLLRLPRSLTLPERHFVRELAQGWREFRSRTWLWTIVVQFAFLNATAGGAIYVLGPLVADRELGGAAAWGAILTSTSVGMVAGGIASLRFRPARLLLVASAAMLLVVPQYFLLAEAAPLAVVAAAAFLAGVGIETFSVFWDTALQQHIPGDRLSRVSAWDMLGSIGFMPIGYAIAGPVGDAIGVSETLWLAGAIYLAGVLAILTVADVRQLRRTDPIVTPSPSPASGDARTASRSSPAVRR